MKTDVIKTIDIKDLCSHCGEDTKWGSGRYVNRIPSDSMWEVETSGGKSICINVDGWMCEECQQMPCDKCDTETVHYQFFNGEALCEECSPEEEDND